MNRDEAILKMKESYPVYHNYFSKDEFIIMYNGEIYDEGGYKWELNNLEDRPFDNWNIWLDINNPVSTQKQGRNEPCNCGSELKYKKCCYLTADERIKVWNDKVSEYNNLIKAIKKGKSVKMYEKDVDRKLSTILSGLEDSSYFEILGRGRV